MERSRISQWVAATLPPILLFMASTVCRASDEPSNPKALRGQTSGLYIKVQLDGPVKLSKLEPGDKVEGKLARDVYSDDLELFPAGDRVELTVDHLEKRRRIPNDHWPWVIKALTPRHEKYPVFKTATVFVPNGAISNSTISSSLTSSGGSKAGEGGEKSLQVTLISVNRPREVRAQAKKKGSAAHINKTETVEIDEASARPASGKQESRKPPVPTMVLEAFETEIRQPSGANAAVPSAAASVKNEILPAGTACKILLLSNISASKSKPGDVVQARLLEPVRLNSRVVLPAGSLFDGSVVKKTPPRWLSRAGSLSLSFTGLTLPGGNHVQVAASLAGAELDRGSHTRIDAEGQLHGERPGKVWMAINLGVTAGLSKEVDDGTQLIIEAIVSTATDASTAGMARIAGTCISGLFLVTRHGRDVVLPRFTEMDISLDRPLSLTKTATAAVPAQGPQGD